MPKPISQRQHQFLQSALQDFADQQLITPEQQQQLATFYPIRDRWNNHLLLILFAAGLVLLAVGQLIAHHWNETSPTLRLTLALLLLLSGGSALWRLRERWQPLAILIHAATVGLAMVIVAQVFQLQGSLAAFMLQWTMLLLPTWLWSRHAFAGQVVQALLALTILSAFNTSDALTLGLTAAIILTVGLALWLRHYSITLAPLVFLALGWLGEQVLDHLDDYRDESLWMLLIYAATLLYPLAKRFAWGFFERFYGALAIIVLGFLYHADMSLPLWLIIWLGLMVAQLVLSVWVWRNDWLRLAFSLTPILIMALHYCVPMELRDVVFSLWAMVLMLMWGTRAIAEQRRAVATWNFLGLALLGAYRMWNEPLLDNAAVFLLTGILVVAFKPKRFVKESNHE